MVPEAVFSVRPAKMKGIHMRKKALALTLMFILTCLAGALQAQTLAQLTTAAVASEGEGCLFMLAGQDAFRTGVAARFNLTSITDLGIQLGLDRICEQSLWGGGADVKVVLLQSRKKFPVNLALDGSFGALDKRHLNQFLFGFGILASGVIEASPDRVIEPYLSFVVLGKITDKDGMNGGGSGGCDCLLNDHHNQTDTLVRAGVRLPVSKETQLLIETRISDRILFGAAFNVIF
jgi:hypothetical protein